MSLSSAAADPRSIESRTGELQTAPCLKPLIRHPDSMNGPVFYIDIDDVLAETTRALAQLAREEFGKSVEFEAIFAFDLRRSLDLSETEYVRFMKAAHEEDFLMGIAPAENAAVTLNAWQRSGARLDLITGRPPKTQAVTAAWLRRQAIPHAKLELIDKYDRYPRSELLDRNALIQRAYDWVIEDSSDLAVFMAQETNAQILLFDRPWNRGLKTSSSAIQRVHSWEEIADCVGLSP